MSLKSKDFNINRKNGRVSMKKKSFKLAAAALLAVITLAGCSSNQNVATLKGAKITEEDLYKELKKDPQTSQVLTNMIIGKIAEESYSKDVDDKEVDKKFKEVEEQYGGKKPFEDILKQNNLDVKSYRQSIKDQLTFQKMMESHVELKDEDLKNVWATYHPAVDVQMMMFDDKEAAEKALAEVNDKGDFTKIAKEKSMDETTKEDGGKLTFDSTFTTTPENVYLPDDIKASAYELEDGKVSDLLTSTNMQTGQEVYYIVKMVKNQKKGNDYKPFKKELTEIATQAKLQDPAFQQEVVGDELVKANVKVVDKDFKDILAPYLPQKEEKSDDKKADTDKEDATETSK